MTDEPKTAESQRLAAGVGHHSFTPNEVCPMPTGEENQAFKRMVKWFNSWLGTPLSDREKTIIAEALSYTREKEVVRGRY